MKFQLGELIRNRTRIGRFKRPVAGTISSSKENLQLRGGHLKNPEIANLTKLGVEIVKRLIREVTAAIYLSVAFFTPAQATTIEFDSGNGGVVFQGDIGPFLDFPGTGYVFQLGDDYADGLVLDSVGIFIGKLTNSAVPQPVFFEIAAFQRGNPTAFQTVLSGIEEIPAGQADWLDFDLNRFNLKRGFQHPQERTRYLIRFINLRGIPVEGRLLSLTNNPTSPTDATYWNQDPFINVIGWRDGVFSAYAPAVRISLASVPTPVPIPSGMVLLASGLGLLCRRRRPRSEGRISMARSTTIPIFLILFVVIFAATDPIFAKTSGTNKEDSFQKKTAMGMTSELNQPPQNQARVIPS